MTAQRTVQSKKMLSEQVVGIPLMYEATNTKIYSRLRASSDYYDLTIRCDEDEFRVHKCIVCPQSTFFRNACKEQKWKVRIIHCMAPILPIGRRQVYAYDRSSADSL